MPTQAEKKKRQEKFLYFLSCSYTRFYSFKINLGLHPLCPRKEIHR